MDMSEHVKPWTRTFNRTRKMFTANMFSAERRVTDTMGRAMSKQDIDVREGGNGVFWSWVTGG